MDQWICIRICLFALEESVGLCEDSGIWTTEALFVFSCCCFFLVCLRDVGSEGPAAGGTSNNEQVVTMGQNRNGLSVGFSVDVLLRGITCCSQA